jgi:hypothetical protein
MEKLIKTIKNKTGRVPRTIIIARNRKLKELENLEIIKKEMIDNNLDSELINKYMDEEYEKIDLVYKKKVNDYLSKYKNNEIILTNSEKKNKRDAAIDFLLKNKTFLEENGVKPEQIKKFVDKARYWSGVRLKAQEEYSPERLRSQGYFDYDLSEQMGNLNINSFGKSKLISFEKYLRKLK